MITLDIEDNSIKIMSVKGRQVESAASLPLEPGLVQDGVIIDRATVGRRITELMSVNGISERSAVVGLNGIHALYRTFKIPKLPKNLMNEAVQREAERVMPVPLNELYTSWETLNLSSIETDICIVGIPRNTVDAMLETLHLAGLQPDALEIKPLALARVTDERDAIVINAQQIGFDIVVIIDGIPELLRSLPFPAGSTSPNEKMDEVKEELERTITFYNSSHKGGEITTSLATFVSGDLGEMLAPTLGRRLKPLPQLLANIDGRNASDYATNIGLALRQARGTTLMPVNLNITPVAYLPKPLPIMQIASWAFLVLGIAIVVMFGVLTFQKYTNVKKLETQVDYLMTQVQGRQGGQSAVKQLQTKIDEAKKNGAAFTQPLDTAAAQRDKVNDGLGKVTSSLPAIVALNTLGYNNGVITVSGISPDDTIIVDYVREMRDSGQFSEVLVTNMTEEEYNLWRFTLTIK